jgi:hypothetical protein
MPKWINYLNNKLNIYKTPPVYRGRFLLYFFLAVVGVIILPSFHRR